MTAVAADGAGWPDLFMAHPEHGRILVRELKVPPNKLTDDQEQWLITLLACGMDVGVWTPNDWVEIEESLGYTQF